jgi:hypothetical protein
MDTLRIARTGREQVEHDEVNAGSQEFRGFFDKGTDPMSRALVAR